MGECFFQRDMSASASPFTTYGTVGVSISPTPCPPASVPASPSLQEALIMCTTVRPSTGLVRLSITTMLFAILAVGPASAEVNMENIFSDEDVQESSRQEDGLYILDYRFHLGEDQPVLVTVIHTDTGHGAGKMLYDGSQRLDLRISFTADVERFTSGGRDEKEYPYHGGIGTGIWDPNDEFISHYWNAIGFNVWSYSFYAGSNSGWTDWRPPSAGDYTLRAVTSEWSHAVFEMTVTVESPLDLDNDGIPDDEDECPASKAASPGTSLNVDQFGCTPEQNVRKIVGLYNQLDLKGRVIREGSPRNGPNVNMDSFFEITIKGGKTIATVDGKDIKVDHTFTGGIVCGDYQCGILNWLDALRASTSKFSEKRTYHDLFNGVEYGAVQSYFGAHQAAIIYPSGTDWKETGTVLDPWYTQEGKAYPVDEWDYLPAPSKYYKDVYPMNGGSAYAADIAHWSIQQKQKQELENKKLCGVIECNIDLRITDTLTGSFMGRVNGEFVNTIPDGRFVAHPTGDTEDDLVWYFELPEGQYDVQIEGRADGDFHLKTVQRDGEIQDYDTCSLTSGSAATLTLSGDDPSPPLILPDGEEVPPTVLSTPTASASFRDDFDGWQQVNTPSFHYTNEGDWDTSDTDGDGFADEVTQTTNSDPTFFVSPDSIGAGNEFNGRFVASSRDDDDDWMGFTFGFQDESNCYVFHWKQADQDENDLGASAEAGISILKLSNFDYGDHESRQALYATEDGPGIEVLARWTTSNNGIGWSWDEVYTFKLSLYESAFRIGVRKTDSSLVYQSDVIAVDGPIDGRFGFYNYSQAHVTYSGFTVKEIPPEPPSPIEGDEWYTYPATGHTYTILEPMTWDEAEQKAVELGGHLVTINDAEENQWIVENLLPLVDTDRVWIGFNDLEEEGSWVWVSGQTPPYTNWYEGEPNDDGSGEDYGMTWNRDAERGFWNDEDSRSINAIVEVGGAEPPSPTPVTTGPIVWIRPPDSLKEGDLEHDTEIRAFREKTVFPLPADVDVNVSLPGTYQEEGDLTPATIPRNTIVNSYYVHVDPVGHNWQTYEGTIQFNEEIIGIIIRDNELFVSQSILGVPNTMYPESEPGFDYNQDTLILDADQRTIELVFRAHDGVDDIRVLTSAGELPTPTEQSTPLPPTPTFTPTATSAPPTPTFTFTPVPPTPTFTPTPVPGGPTPVQTPVASFTNTFDASDLVGNEIMEFPGTFSGLDPALTSIADVIPGGGEEFGVAGNAIRVSAQPGEGTLLLIGNTPIPAPNKAVIRAAVYTSTPSAQVFIAIIDVDQNGNLSTDLGLDQLLTTKTLHNRWGFVSAIHESQTGFVKPVVQVVGNITSCDVYVDNVEVFVLERDKLYPGRLFGAR